MIVGIACAGLTSRNPGCFNGRNNIKISLPYAEFNNTYHPIHKLFHNSPIKCKALFINLIINCLLTHHVTAFLLKLATELTIDSNSSVMIIYCQLHSRILDKSFLLNFCNV